MKYENSSRDFDTSNQLVLVCTRSFNMHCIPFSSLNENNNKTSHQIKNNKQVQWTCSHSKPQIPVQTKCQ